MDRKDRVVRYSVFLFYPSINELMNEKQQEWLLVGYFILWKGRL